MAQTTVFYNSVRDIVFDVEDAAGKPHPVRINGSGATLRGTDINPLPGVGAYGVTFGVDADLWAEVEKTYGSMSIFKKGYIKATTPKTEKAAREELATKENGEEPEATQESGKKRGRRKASN